jgi:micrococcal nuclease
MNLNRKFVSIALIFLFVSLACGITGDVTPVTPAGPSTPAGRVTVTVAVTPANPSTPAGEDTVTVARVLDGDTVELTNGRRVRYIGINTPERGQPYYQEATAANQRLVEGKTVRLEFDADTFDQYGRSLAYVWVGQVMANLEMVKQGYANAYTVPPNVRYENEFRQAEREAREAGRGLWAGSDVMLKIIHIEADAPGRDNENPNGEWIEIANQGRQPVNMAGFTLKDEANNIYIFGDFTVAPGVSFRLFSGQGRNTATELYWGLVNRSVWNNDSDSAFLRDAQGALVDSFTY